VNRRAKRLPSSKPKSPLSTMSFRASPKPPIATNRPSLTPSSASPIGWSR